MSGTTRRDALVGTAAVIGLSLTQIPGLAQAQAYGYAPVDKPVATASADQIEVLEFLWLGCPHCYRFEPAIEGWKRRMPDHAMFTREAPPLNPSWESHSRGFYASRMLGLEDRFVQAMFEAIHENGNTMRDAKEIAALAGSLGADESYFLETMQSDSVEMAIRHSVDIAVNAGIKAVPSVMINGKYITSSSLAGGNDGMIAVIDRLVETEKEAMGL